MSWQKVKVLTSKQNAPLQPNVGHSDGTTRQKRVLVCFTEHVGYLRCLDVHGKQLESFWFVDFKGIGTLPQKNAEKTGQLGYKKE